MGEQSFFQKALTDFTYEAACGGAIRHLADLGYTVKEIKEQLDFPVAYERVQKAVWEHLVRREVILLEEPGMGSPPKRAVYVREYDKYGKASFRRVIEDDENRSRGADKAGKAICWKERDMSVGGAVFSEELFPMLRSRTEENGQESSYAACDFGLTVKKDLELYRKMLGVLDERQKEYLEGLPWEQKRVYHRLDSRMLEIVTGLYREGCYHGPCFFLKTEEKIIF